MTEWDIGSWLHRPLGQHYKVIMGVHCHKSVPVLIWPSMSQGCKTNQSSCSDTITLYACTIQELVLYSLTWRHLRVAYYHLLPSFMAGCFKYLFASTDRWIRLPVVRNWGTGGATSRPAWMKNWMGITKRLVFWCLCYFSQIMVYKHTQIHT